VLDLEIKLLMLPTLAVVRFLEEKKEIVILVSQIEA